MEYFRQFRKYAMWYMSGMKTMNTARSVTYAASGQIIKYITPGSSYGSFIVVLFVSVLN